MEIQKLYPVCKDYLWGGRKLKEKFGKNCDCESCAESWELSFHKDGKTRIADGRTLEETLTEKEKGTNVCEFAFFPNMIKLIDAKSNLSVQVHPSDDYALKHENSYGKTEMWYIVDAEEDAGIYLGFNRDVTLEEYKCAIKNNSLTELMNFYPVKKGESYFIPAGTIHAIGAGCLICEIQQNSNLTYRVYDYNRYDKNGCKRELHIDKALEVTNRKKHQIKQLSGNTIGVSKYFNVQKLTVDGICNLSTNDKSFHCITCLEGSGKIGEIKIERGDSFFVPANFGRYILEGKMSTILTDVRKYYICVNVSKNLINAKIFDDEENVILHKKIPTNTEKAEKLNVENIELICKELMEKANISTSDITEIKINS